MAGEFPGVPCAYRTEADARPAGTDGLVWHRSGDVGNIDQDGRLWIEGRTAHVITTAAGPVTPVPVEVALSPGFHEIVITDEAGQSTALRARIARRGTTKICWNFPSVTYCNVPQLAEAEKHW